MTTDKPRFFSQDLLKVAASAALINIVAVTGFAEFFVSFGIAPMGSLARLLGMLVVPVVPTYFIARFFSRRTTVSFVTLWLVGTIALSVLMAIGVSNRT